MHVSFVMPAYNAGKFIGQAIESILSQTLTTWELIIVDDKSTDDTLDIINHYNDSRIRIIHREINSGSARLPLLDGIRQAKYEWISCIGDDDFIESSFLERLIMRQKQTEAEIVGSTLQLCNDAGYQVNKTIPDNPFDGCISGQEAFFLTILSPWKFGANGMLVRRDAYLKAAEQNPYFYMNSDEVDIRRILLESSSVSMSDANYYYRQHNNSITKKLSYKLFERLLTNNQLCQLVKDYLPNDREVEQKIITESRSSIQYYQIFFIRNRNSFSDIESKRIKNIIRQAFDDNRTFGTAHSTIKEKIVFSSFPIFFFYTHLKYTIEKMRNE